MLADDDLGAKDLVLIANKVRRGRRCPSAADAPRPTLAHTKHARQRDCLERKVRELARRRRRCKARGERFDPFRGLPLFEGRLQLRGSKRKDMAAVTEHTLREYRRLWRRQRPKSPQFVAVATSAVDGNAFQKVRLAVSTFALREHGLIPRNGF